MIYMKFTVKLIIISFLFLFITMCNFNSILYSEELFKNYIVKADEVLYRFAKQNLNDHDYIVEFLKFNSINAVDIDANKTKFKDLGLKDGDILLIPSSDILKSIKKAKTDAEKNELVQQFKKVRHSDFYIKISELKSKLKTGENVSERSDKISKDNKKK